MSYFADLLATQILIIYFTIEVGSTGTISMDNSTCLQNIYEITDEISKTLLWDGRALLKHCSVGFGVPDKNVHKFVIETEKFSVVDCDFTLSYFYGDTTVPKKKYTCTSDPDFFTIENVPYIFLQFDTFRSSSSSVRLNISVQYSNFILGTSIGSVSFMVLIILIIYIIRRRNNERCELIDDCCDCCCDCVHDIANICRREARNTYFYFCSNCGSDDAVTEQPTSENEPQVGGETVQPLSSRRSSVNNLNPGSHECIVMEEPPVPLLSTSLDPPPYEPPPPSYEDYVRGVPPPCYPK